ncbi:cytochrome C-552 [Thermus brockianus]|jgi:mono/diheme cytochrome c family protein|uniref:Cytochrome C-552 n=2 Tax=Thermaceae TaxID=188786 RepID=A0A1J0LQP1_THEBO|nr:cytochrome c [Thermus brockianus]APD08633.1 cytochrome C-552 [Thermus brockianus]
MMRNGWMILALGLWGMALAQDGGKLYAQYCAGCHQPTGQGVPGAFPSLVGLDPLFKDPKGRAYLVQVVAFGLQGSLKVGSFTYNGLMPPIGQLGDEEIARLLNHIGASFGNRNPQPFTPVEVQKARERRLTPQEVLKGRPTR